MDNNHNLTNINNDCLPIEGNDHVLIIEEKTTLKVEVFKNNIKNNLPEIIKSLISVRGIKISDDRTILGEFNNIVWNSSPIECEVLFLGKDRWQQGKLNTKVYLDLCSHLTRTSYNHTGWDVLENQIYYQTGTRSKHDTNHIYIYNYQIILEFFPKKPEIKPSIEDKTFLDNIRQSIE
jgi:hypothetical protein